MEITLLVKSFVGLVTLLLLLITFLFYGLKKKKVQIKQAEPIEKWDNDYKSLDELLKFNRELEKRNEEYKREINDCITKGLNSRGF